MDDRPVVLFACVRNAGRSQMAAALMRHRSDGGIEVRSAGSDPAAEIDPGAVEAMAELGIELTGEPRRLDDEIVREADVVVTMGCGDDCPFHPSKRYEDWQLDDPAGLPLERIRPIRDEIDGRVQALAAELRASRERA